MSGRQFETGHPFANSALSYTLAARSCVTNVSNLPGLIFPPYVVIVVVVYHLIKCNKWALGDSHMDAYLNKDWICMYIEYLLNPHFLNIFYIEQNMNAVTFLYQTLEADDIWLRLIIFCSVADPDPFHSNGSGSGLKNQPKVIEK